MKRGFTLIEVCLVMLIFGVAVSSLMALFPVSLRQGNMAVSDSVVTTFADGVMNTIAANAASITDWNEWKDKGNFKEKVLQGVQLGEIENYLGIDNSYINSKVEVEEVTTPEDYGGRLYRVALRVKNIESLSWNSAAVFVTYFCYMGEVP